MATKVTHKYNIVCLLMRISFSFFYVAVTVKVFLTKLQLRRHLSRWRLDHVLHL